MFTVNRILNENETLRCDNSRYLRIPNKVKSVVQAKYIL